MALVMITAWTVSCVHDPLVERTDPDGGVPQVPGCITNGDICFESSVLPIFVSYCAKSGCHDSKTAREGYVLNNYANITRRGISPGTAGGSKLYRVLNASGEDRMPPDATLTAAQKDSIAVWINEGAQNTTNCNCFCDDTQYTYAAIIQPLLASNCIGCHKPGSLSGSVDLSTYDKVKIQVNNGKLIGSVTQAAGYVGMPQGGKLSACQISQIQQWVNAGAPNN